ncbi:MAG: AAA family ATPase, partial [Patescibacteria group bacterium]|nr:AAA family ATPase [Patescibacteria group bacterium]
KIKFESVSASNTLSFRKVNLQFDEPGIYLVVGENKTWRNNSNAAGKSNLFSILRIGLYGSTTKYQRHDAICRRWMGKGKKSWVRVRLKDAEDHSVSVLRGRRPKHILRVLRDQKEVGSGNQKQATQEVINRMCGFTEEVFDHSVLIDQKLLHTAQSFLYGTDKDKKQLLDQVLGIGHFLKVGEVVKQKYANWSLEEAEVKERLREGREKISYLGAHIRSLEKTRHRQSVLREVKSFKLALAKLNYRKEVTEKAERKIKFFSKKCSEFYSIYTKRSLAVQSIVDKRMRFEGEIERCEKLAAKKCPTCRQMVSAKLVSDWVRELESSLKESRIFEEKQKKELDILKSEFITLEERKAKWERIAKKCNTEKVQFILLTEKIRTLKKNLKRAPETVLLKRMRSERASWRMKQKVYSQTLSAFRQDGQFWNYCLSVFSREGLVNFIYAGLCRSLNASAKFYSDVFTDGIIQLRFEPQTTRKSGKVVNEFQVRV